MKLLPSRHFSVRSRGFALIVTLSLMILLTVIAVGLLSLSVISLRSSSNEQMMLEARQNARLALILAIGELQSTAGPDRSVTAPAQIRGTSALQPHLTGVWQGWKWDGNGTPDYPDQKQSKFLRWLVSTRVDNDAKSLDFIKTAPGGAVGTLVRGDRDPAEKDQVDAQIVTVTSGNKNLRQGYAWAVFDESTKLPTALPEPTGKSVTAAVNRMSAAPLPGYVSPTKRDWDPIGLLAGNRSKLITAGQSSLIGVAAADRGFHDLTSRSVGIVADAGKGGLAIDLSRLFDATTLPTTYANRFIYSGTDTPLVPPAARFSGANPFPSPDPSWSLLHSHYRQYKQLSGGLNPTINTTASQRPAAGTTGNSVQNDPFFKTQQLAPVIAKAQFVFSLSFGWHGALKDVEKTGNDKLPDSDPKKDQYITWLVIDPVITLWNPYNVNLRFTGGRVDLYRVPLTFRLYKNGNLINSEYTHMANTFLAGSEFTNRKDTYFRLNLLSETGTVAAPGEILMAPGEHIVFTASNHVKTFNKQFSDIGLELRPGFKPPAGNASDKAVGGVSTLNVCVSASGANNGVDYGKSVRTIAVKAGDRMQIEVKAGRAAVDKPKETGGKEISGFLKYYAGSPSNPRLIGGIELDYGDNEAQHLPSISMNDLPMIVVSGDIPKSPAQADNYQGTKPPPAVRFKEPFLISTFQLKTERDSKFPSRGWIHNSPVNLYASEGLDQKEAWSAQQYELQWEAMTDWPPSSPTIEISNTKNRGYGGPGIYAQSGLEFATHSAIPLAPALSLAQLRHAPLNTGGQLPLVSQVIGNSFASPLLDNASIRKVVDSRTFLDHSFYANSALFDQYFFSGLADPGGPLDRKTTTRNAITALFDAGTPLPNPRFIPHHGGRSTAEIVDAIIAPDGYLKTAAHLLIDSPFNLNSTRVDVWEAFLGSTFGTDVPLLQGGLLSSATGNDVAVARHLPSGGSSFESGAGQLAQDLAKWNGHRRLTPVQIRRLAEEIVKEIQSRGPFQSVAEFVNRRAEDGLFGQSGALQTAIERSEINKPAIDPAFNVVTGTIPGNAADGAPGILNQADILTPIAPVLTARGDTFRIRAYGEAGPLNGTKVRVWCEAVVQRVPEYLDTTDAPWVTPTIPVNVRFGRRYEMVSFRWLSSSEI